MERVGAVQYDGEYSRQIFALGGNSIGRAKKNETKSRRKGSFKSNKSGSEREVEIAQASDVLEAAADAGVVAASALPPATEAAPELVQEISGKRAEYDPTIEDSDRQESSIMMMDEAPMAKQVSGKKSLLSKKSKAQEEEAPKFKKEMEKKKKRRSSIEYEERRRLDAERQKQVWCPPAPS